MGLPPGDTKEEPLRRVISVLEASGISYAVIGGIAVQLHTTEPRTTLEFDLAVNELAHPGDALSHRSTPVPAADAVRLQRSHHYRPGARGGRFR